MAEDKELLAMVPPPKPLSEMTAAELDAFADSIFESIAPQEQRES